MFVLQFRACRLEDEDKFRTLPRDIGLPKPLHVVAQVAMQHCLFCGFSLQEFIKANGDEFARLCDEHSKFIM